MMIALYSLAFKMFLTQILFLCTSVLPSLWALSHLWSGQWPHQLCCILFMCVSPGSILSSLSMSPGRVNCRGWEWKPLQVSRWERNVSEVETQRRYFTYFCRQNQWDKIMDCVSVGEGEGQKTQGWLRGVCLSTDCRVTCWDAEGTERRWFMGQCWGWGDGIESLVLNMLVYTCK